MDEAGEVLAVNQSGWVHVSYAVSGLGNFWVSTDCIIVGSEKKLGSYSLIYDHSPTVISSGVSSYLDPDLNTGEQTIKKLISALFLQQVTLDATSPAVLDILNDRTARTSAQAEIIAGLDGSFREIIANPDFTIADLKEKLPVVKSNERRSLIYVLVIGTEIYVSRTDQAGQRLRGHMQEARGQSNMRTLTTAKRSNPGWTMHALCTLRMHLALQSIAEQVMLLLLGTYRAALLGRDTNIDSSTGAAQDITEKALQNADDKRAAQRLVSIAADVFVKTGWKGFVSRSGSGATVGLNRSSPISEEWYKKVAWVRHEFKDQRVFR